MAAVVLLQCGDCGTLLRSAEEAQQHAKITCHTNFCESTEAILHLVCTVCGKPCRSKTESDFHAKRTGHTEFQDKTAEAAEEEERRAREKARQKLEEICKESDFHAKRTGHTEFQDKTAEAAEEEERRAREKARQKLEEICEAETRRHFGLPPRNPALPKLFRPVLEEEKSSLPISPATKAQQMSECLRTIKHNHMDDEVKVKTAFSTLLTYAKNVATNPNEEKYRKIRLSNAAFQDRVGKLPGGIEFLELCGFEKIEGGEFLYLQREKVDMGVLYSAGNELNNAIRNP